MSRHNKGTELSCFNKATSHAKACSGSGRHIAATNHGIGTQQCLIRRFWLGALKNKIMEVAVKSHMMPPWPDYGVY
jgi:hypothetical protein